MAKPRLIILIRHAQSEGNKNREIHQTIPDHRVKLTADGWAQAYDAGRRLRALLRADDTLHFFTSPYRRTRETTEGILATLTADEPGPSPFRRDNIKVYEEPRLREQDFGNFQPCSAEMERMWQERADYGHFFYRIPNGESAADAYDRVSGFNESLWRQFGDDDFASVCVLVTHGLMSRVFLMKWYHFSVEYFEDLRNVNHCEFLIMRKQGESGKYILENNLRTWSELRRERALLKEKEREKEAANGLNGSGLASSSTSTGTGAKDKSKLDKAAAPAPRRWGGCPNGCTHDKSFRIRSALVDLIKRDGTAIYASPSNSSASLTGASSRPGDDSSSALESTHGTSSPAASSLASRRPAARRFQSATDLTDELSGLAAPHIDITRACEEVVSSPDGTPSFISAEDRLGLHPKTPPGPLLHVGRDFGGTYSGHASDADSSEDDNTRSHVARSKFGTNGVGHIPGQGRVQAQSLTAQLHTKPEPQLTTGCCGAANSSDNPAGDDPPGEVEDRIGDAMPKHRGGSNGVPDVDGGGVNGHKRDRSGMGRGTYANRLGDAPHCDHHHHEHDHHHHEHDHSDSEHDHEHHHHHCCDHDDHGPSERGAGSDADDDLDAAERENKSLRGSVY